MAYLRVIRPLNLLLIIMVQSIIKYGLLEAYDIPLALDNLSFGILVFATVCIAAAGNIVNDIFDINVDTINKPGKMIIGRLIPERAAYNYYIVLNVAGVAAGFYLANLVGHPGLAAIFIVISALLYIYATQVKSFLVIGNILISCLVAMSLIIMILFDIYPAIGEAISEIQVSCTKAILLYSGFAFYINLIREIVKDLEDVDGDKNGGRSTIPIVMGRRRTVNLVFVLGVIALVSILIFTYLSLYHFRTLTFYFVFLVAAPLLFFCIKVWNAENKQDFKLLSRILKLVMFTGIASLLFYSEIIPHL